MIHPGGDDDRWEELRASRLERSVAGLSRLWELCRARGLVLTVETPLPHLLGGRLEDFDWIL